MKPILKDGALWTLRKLDKAGFLAKEFEEGRIYLSDSSTGRQTLLNRNDPTHKEYFDAINYLLSMAGGGVVEVYHVVSGVFNMMFTPTKCVNYLYISEDIESHKMNYERYKFVFAYVDNKDWDIQEHGSIAVVQDKGILIRAA